jgi:hypothetical protein
MAMAMLTCAAALLAAAGVASADKHDGLGMAVGEPDMLRPHPPPPPPNPALVKLIKKCLLRPIVLSLAAAGSVL